MAFSAANKKFVFPAYMYALGTGKITGFSDNNITLSFITKPIPSSFDMTSIFFKYYNFKGLEFGTLQESLQYVNNVRDGSVNADSETSSHNTYEALRRVPVERYIFTKGNSERVSACPLTADFDYSPSALQNKRLSGYFRAEYELSGKWDEELQTVVGPYSHEEYNRMGVKEELVIESMPFKTGNAFEFQDREDLAEQRKKNFRKTYKGMKGADTYDYDGRALAYGSLGYILSYEDDTHRGGNRIPMAYYEFANPIFSNCDYIKINWNENGFIEAK